MALTIDTPFFTVGHGADTYRLAMLVAGGAFSMENPPVKIITGALAGYGYTLGQNLEFRSYGGGADAQLSGLPQLAKDIAATGVDAVVVFGWPPANAMKATGVPTVVAVGAGDPVATACKFGPSGGQYHRDIGQRDNAEHQAS